MTSATTRLHWHPLSGHSHRARLMLSLLDREFDLVEVDLGSGAQTAPFARTVANSTIVIPNRMKFHVAMTWICRAIGSAGLSPPMNSAITDLSARVRSTTSAAVIATE